MADSRQRQPMNDRFRLLRRLVAIAAALLAGLSGYIAIVALPGVWFDRQCESGVLSAHVDSVDCARVAPALRDIETLIRFSELYRAELHHDLYFAGEQRLLRRIHPAPVLTANLSWPPWLSQSISFRHADWQDDALVHPISGNRVRLRQTMAHEVVHSLQKARLGARAAHAAPLWKREGYADYVADRAQREAPGYRHADELRNLLDRGVNEVAAGCQQRHGAVDDGGYRWPACYRLARLMWEFLIDQRGLSHDEVMDRSLTADAVLEQMGVRRN